MNFSARIAAVVDSERRSGNRRVKVLVEWVEPRELRILIGAHISSKHWTWLAGGIGDML